MLWLLAVALAVGSPGLVGQWANDAGSYAFAADGRVRVTYAGGAVFDGVWQLQGDVLSLQTSGGAQQFRVAVAGTQLQLVDATGASFTFARQGQAAAPEPAAKHGGKPAAGALSDAQFAHFLQTYRALDGNAVTAHLAAMTSDQHTMLNVFENLGSDVWTRACTGTSAAQLVWPAATGPVNCMQLQQQYAQALQLGVDPAANADLQRDQVLNSYRCKTGEIDKATCATYVGITTEVNQGMHDTMIRSIQDMGTTCTRFYDEHGGYVGCW